MSGAMLDAFSDEFCMYVMKVQVCTKGCSSRDWAACPYAHPPFEAGARRDPSMFRYCAQRCPNHSKVSPCPRGSECPYAHNVFEEHLHPSRFRTEMCNLGANCKRKLCFFAHKPSQLRAPGRDAAQPPSHASAGFQRSSSLPAQLVPALPSGAAYGVVAGAPEAPCAGRSPWGTLSLSAQGSGALTPVPERAASGAAIVPSMWQSQMPDVAGGGALCAPGASLLQGQPPLQAAGGGSFAQCWPAVGRAAEQMWLPAAVRQQSAHLAVPQTPLTPAAVVPQLAPQVAAAAALLPPQDPRCHEALQTHQQQLQWQLKVLEAQMAALASSMPLQFAPSALDLLVAASGDLGAAMYVPMME